MLKLTTPIGKPGPALPMSYANGEPVATFVQQALQEKKRESRKILL